MVAHRIAQSALKAATTGAGVAAGAYAIGMERWPATAGAVVVALAAAAVTLSSATATACLWLLRVRRVRARDNADAVFRRAVDRELITRLTSLDEDQLIAVWRESLGPRSENTVDGNASSS